MPGSKMTDWEKKRAAMSEHDWFTKRLSKEQIAQILDFYKSRYGQ